MPRSNLFDMKFLDSWSEFSDPSAAYQSLLRDLPQRRQDPDLDCRVRLCARRHPQKTTPIAAQPLQYPTDSEPHRFRENSINSSTYELRLHNQTGGPT